MSVDSIHSLARTIDAGTVLFEEGTSGGGLIILLAGRLDVFKGREKVGTISEPGAYVGESTFVTGNVRNATVIAQTSATIIRLTNQQSAEFLQRPEIEGKLVRTVAARLSDANDSILEKSKRVRELEDTLTQLLLDLKNVYDDFKDVEDLDAVSLDIIRRIRLNVNKVDMLKVIEKRVTI